MQRALSRRWSPALLILLLSTPAVAQEQSAPGSPPLPPPGRMIDLGGWRLHLNCTGEARASQPTVILEAGAGGLSVDWSLVQPAVARFARVCSYDRAGAGWSDLGPRPRTMRQVVWELHTLLEKAGERPPYVLVGHSFGGQLARLYAWTYPGEVAGIVLCESGHERGTAIFRDGKMVRVVDTATGQPVPPVKTSDPVREKDIPPAILGQIEAAARQFSPRANSPPHNKLPAEAQRMRAWALAQVKHYAANDNPFAGEELAAMLAERGKNKHPLGDLPLIVLSRGVSEAKDEGGRAVEDEHTSNQAELVALSRRGKQVTARRSGHHILLDEPDVVVSAIREVLSAAQPTPAPAQSGPSVPPLPPPGQLGDLSGWRLHPNCTKAKTSQPAVILEAGAGDFSVTGALCSPRWRVSRASARTRLLSMCPPSSQGHPWCRMSVTLSDREGRPETWCAQEGAIRCRVLRAAPLGWLHGPAALTHRAYL